MRSSRGMRRAPWIISTCLLVALVSGCGGEQYTSPAQSGWSDDLGDPTGQPSRHTETLTEAQAAPAPLSTSQPTPPTEKRVRHDVMIAKEAPHEAICSCLAAIVTQPTDSKLMWQADVPKLGEDVVVVAVSGKGVPCAGLAEDAPRRPSIAGVEQVGLDMVVTIEDLPPGRPLASGAVIPKPAPGGSVYVKPKNGKVPYGRPMPGAQASGGRCKVR